MVCRFVIHPYLHNMLLKGFVFLMLAITSLLSAEAQNNTVQTDEKPFILGKSVRIYSRNLNENRVLNIYFPEGYTDKDTIRYPVIYLLDGGADEDFIHIVGLVQFNTFPWIARMPRSIVVGIANVDRKRDFTYPTTLLEDKQRYPGSGHSDHFISFLKNELQPFIAKNYKTNNFKTIIGESLGGLLATEIVLKQPDLFDQYIIISPSLWWDNGSLLNINPVLPSNRTKVYIGVGKEGVWPGKVPHVGEVDANLLADKLINLHSKEMQVSFDYLPQENHATILHQAVFNAFRLLYPVKQTE